MKVPACVLCLLTRFYMKRNLLWYDCLLIYETQYYEMTIHSIYTILVLNIIVAILFFNLKFFFSFLTKWVCKNYDFNPFRTIGHFSAIRRSGPQATILPQDVPDHRPLYCQEISSKMAILSPFPRPWMLSWSTLSDRPPAVLWDHVWWSCLGWGGGGGRCHLG